MNESALADVKILDFAWVMAAPAATRVLADYGATIVRVESATRFDTGRTLFPFVAGKGGAENSAMFHCMNAGKRMLSLDLKRPEAREIILDLVRWADVVVESFSPKAMRKFGFDYASLVEVKPDLVMLSSCLMGQTGPLAGFAGYGNLSAAITGFVSHCAWPDRPPAGPFSAYTDYVSPRFTVCAILAALDHRRRTGEGQYIDQAQAESALHFLTPAVLDYTVNGRLHEPAGNRDSAMAPHGVYAAAGEDRWIAIVVPDDAAWPKLAAAIGRGDLAADPRFRLAADRVRHADELDAAVTAWTASRAAEDLERDLQAIGIPASVVRNSSDLANDEQLLHHNHFVRLPHGDGETVVEGTRSHLSRTPAAVTGSSPTLGKDNQAILEQILGYSEEQITAIVTSGVLE